MGGKKGNKSKKSKSTKEKNQEKAKALAKKNISTYGSQAAAKAANQKRMKNAAAARHAKFKQTRVQTFGGKKTSFSKAEQKRITNAGYSVAGYSKAKPNVGAGTAAMVAADNAQYGTSFPAGSFGFSDEGKAQAAANIAAARDKTYGTNIKSGQVPGQGGAMSAAARQAAAKQLAAKKAEDTRKSTFDPNRALNYAKGLNLFNTANIMAPGGDMRSWYNTGSDPSKSFRQVLRDEKTMSQRTQGVGKGAWNPARGMPGYGSIRNVLTGKPFNTKFEGGFETGPTEANRRVFNNLSKAYIGAQLFKQGQTGSLTDQVVSNTPNVNVGGLSIGFNSPESTDVGARLGKFFTSVPGKVANLFSGEANAAETTAGGLNIGGGVDSGDEGSKTSRTIFSKAKGLADFAFNDKTDFDNLGSGLFGKGIVTPQDVKSDFKTSVKKIGLPETLALGIENVRDYNRIKDADNKALAFAKNVNADQFAKTLKFAEDSKAVQKAGENLEALTGQKNVNLPSDFKAQIKNVIEGAQEVTGGIEQGKVNNRLFMKNRVDEINILLANVNQNPKLSTLSKVAGQFDPKTNPNADNMTSLQKIAAGFDPTSPNALALSATDRGITGSGGNLLIGGKMSDIYRQATGNIEGGVNAGIPKGQVGLSNADMFNVATSAIKNINTPGTLSAKQADSIQRTIKGGVTPSSLIKGALPNFGGGSGSTINRLRSSAGSSPTTLAAATPTSVEEILPLPTTVTQTGTDSSNLASIMQNAYQNQMSLYGMDPNYMANFRQPRFNRPRKRFRQVFNRGYF